MGETKTEPTTKQHKRLCFLGKSSSDSELAPAKNRGRWSFLHSLTVDELARYRRRRVQGRPKDTLCRTEGSLNNIVSEYRRAFRASNEDVSKENQSPLKKKYHPEEPDALSSLEPRSLDFIPGYDQRIPEQTVLVPPEKKEPSCDLETDDVRRVMDTSTESSKFVNHNIDCRRALQRRGTSLRHDGKFRSSTEQSSYVPHEGYHRAELARRPTSLKMEGDVATMSEKCEKFIEWLNVSRPELARLPNQLKLEGEFETSTENHANYVPFVGARRPEILRQSANLKMEGEAFLIPEYTANFRDHHVREKRAMTKPDSNLKSEGRFYNSCTETSERYVNPKINAISAKNVEPKYRRQEEPTRNQSPEKIVDLVTRYEHFQDAPIEMIDSAADYSDFLRDRAKLAKPEDEIGKSDGSKVFASPTRSKFSSKIDADPEYRSKYLDLSKDSPVYRKPPLALRPSAGGYSRYDSFPDKMSRSSDNVNRIGRYSESPKFEGTRYHYQPVSEIRSQYVPHGQVPKTESMKMPGHLHLEGTRDLMPEYRNAYCTSRNYQPSGEPRMHRRRERSSSESRKRDYSVNGDVDNDAFRVLNSRVSSTEEGIVGKPPSGSRRSSLTLTRQQQREVEATSDNRNRDETATYRLHVCNVDDAPRGFARRRDSNVQRDPDPPPRRSYSPSFAKGDRDADKIEDKAFYVIENEQGNDPMTRYKNEIRRRRPSINNYVDHANNVSIDKDREISKNKTPKSWMRPWYDNVGTI